MTEQEAQGKACPWFVAPKCLTRGCMAWIPMLDESAGMGLGLLVADAGGARPITKDDGSCARIRDAIKRNSP